MIYTQAYLAIVAGLLSILLLLTPAPEPTEDVSVVATSTIVAETATTTATSTTSSVEPEKERRSSGSAPAAAPVSPPTSKQEPRYTLAPAGEPATIKISSAAEADPKFISVTISPLHVYVGETQTFTAKVTASEPVVSVTAVTELDHETLSLALAPTGSDTFSASWVVRDTHVKTYHTTFTAETASGKRNSVTLAWSDPCSGVTQGTSSSLSGSCTVSDVSGLDGGTLTIPNGTTLTLNTGSTWVWNPGSAITVNGSIAVNGSAQLKKGYLFYSGDTNDFANTSAMVYGANSTLANHVRVGTWFAFNSESFAQLNTLYTSNVVTIRGISNGTAVSAVGGGNGEFGVAVSINGGAWVTSGTINPGQTLQAKLRTGSEEIMPYSATVTVGNSSATYTVTTGSFGGPGGGCGDLPCP